MMGPLLDTRYNQANYESNRDTVEMENGFSLRGLFHRLQCLGSLRTLISHDKPLSLLIGRSQVTAHALNQKGVLR